MEWDLLKSFFTSWLEKIRGCLETLSLSHICELFSEWSSETLPYRVPALSLPEGYECFAPKTASSCSVDGESLQCTDTPWSTAPSPQQEKKPKPHHSRRKPAGRAKRIHHKALQEVISGSTFGFATVDADCFEKKKKQQKTLRQELRS